MNHYDLTLVLAHLAGLGFDEVAEPVLDDLQRELGVLVGIAIHRTAEPASTGGVA